MRVICISADGRMWVKAWDSTVAWQVRVYVRTRFSAWGCPVYRESPVYRERSRPEARGGG